LSCKNPFNGRNKGGDNMSNVRSSKKISSYKGEGSQKKVLRRLIEKSATMKPTIWIGKNGITETLIGQVVLQLKANKIVKLRVQKPLAETESMKDIVSKILKASNCSLVNIRGRTFTIYKQNQDDWKNCQNLY